MAKELCGCIPSLMHFFARFLGLGFALCVGTTKPAAEKYPTSCILSPGDAPDLATLQRSMDLGIKLPFQSCSEVGTSGSSPGLQAAAFPAWRIISCPMHCPIATPCCQLRAFLCPPYSHCIPQSCLTQSSLSFFCLLSFPKWWEFSSC